MEDRQKDEIAALLERIQGAGDERAVLAAQEELQRYRAEALARPNAERVALLRVRLKRKLAEIVEAFGRGG